MKYSLTSARTKQIIKDDTKLWILFVALVFALFVGFKIFTIIHISLINSNIESNKITRADFETKTKELNEKIEFILSEAKLVSEIDGRNRVIKDSLINIFDLVPDQIYLTELNITAKSLVIKGYTPSKEVFNYLLKPPLESIFETTETSFYPQGNGWLLFNSVSKSNEKLIYER